MMNEKTRQALEMAIEMFDEMMRRNGTMSHPQHKVHVACKEALAQPTQKAFWEWLPKAYRDGDIGEAPKFTKYNMEVAYRAGFESAQPTQEPVGHFFCETNDGVVEWNQTDETNKFARPLYTHPAPAREPLSEKQLDELIEDDYGVPIHLWYDFARSIEKAHGIVE